MKSSFQDKICLIKEFQNLLYSPACDIQFIKEKIEKIKDSLSPNEIDHQLILAFSLDYHKIPIYKSLLSKSNLGEKDFIHFDQELLFHLFRSNISFPILVITKKSEESKIKK